jgi:tRNA A37 threonylcarbamoyladenosine modification protein TsaB
VIPVSSLEALAGGLAGASEELAVLEARRGEVYALGFGADREPLPGALGTPRALPAQLLAAEVARRGRGPVRLVGSGAHLVRPLMPAEVAAVQETLRCDAALVAACAARRLAAGERPVAGFAVRPLYLRAPDARPPRPLVAPAGALAGQGQA